MTQYKKVFRNVSIIILVVLLIWAYADSSKDVKLLNTKGSFIIGEVYKSDNHRIYSRFNVGGKKYKCISPYKENQMWLREFGLEVLIKYYIDDPKLNRMIVLGSNRSVRTDFAILIDSLKEHEFSMWEIGNTYP